MVGGIISGLVSSGIQLYNEFGVPSAAQRAGQFGGQLKNLANEYLSQPFTNQSFWNLDIPAMAQQSLQFGMAQTPALNQFNMQQLQRLLGQALPGYQGMVGQAAANTQQLLGGNIPADVQNQIQRSAAFGALRGGFAGTGAAAGLTARDLGLTSLQLQGQGQTQLENLIGTASRYLMPQPVDPTKLLPLQDLITGTQWSKTNYYDAVKNMYQARVNATSAQYGGAITPIGGAAGGNLAGLLGLLTGQNPAGGGAGGGSTGQSGGLLGMIMGGLGGLFGGGGGGNAGLINQFGGAASASDITGGMVF